MYHKRPYKTTISRSRLCLVIQGHFLFHFDFFSKKHFFFLLALFCSQEHFCSREHFLFPGTFFELDSTPRRTTIHRRKKGKLDNLLNKSILMTKNGKISNCADFRTLAYTVLPRLVRRRTIKLPSFQGAY